MYNIFWKKKNLNEASTEKVYLIVQTTCIMNSVKQVYLASFELLQNIDDNELKANRYREVYYHHASTLFEVFYLLDKDLLKKYKRYIDKNLLQDIESIVNKYKSRKDIQIELLRDIRNKHAYHIAYDDNYFNNFIKDGANIKDYKIGICESKQEKDIIYTIDMDLFMTYLISKYQKTEVELYDLMDKAIKDYTNIIIKLFTKILAELVKNEIYLEKI
jgi:hypothetical protein